jgi:hypothetical protein
VLREGRFQFEGELWAICRAVGGVTHARNEWDGTPNTPRDTVLQPHFFPGCQNLQQAMRKTTSVLHGWAGAMAVRPMSTAHILPADQAHLHYEALRFSVRETQRQL